MITKQKLQAIQAQYQQDFVYKKKQEIEGQLIGAAMNMKSSLEIEYHPLLDSFYEELKSGGLKYEDRGLSTITFSW